MRNRPIKDFIKGTHSETVSDDGNIEVIGNSRVIVECAENILEYDNERVRLRTKKYIVFVTGQNLSLESYGGNIVIIDGAVKNISFE